MGIYILKKTTQSLFHVMKANELEYHGKIRRAGSHFNLRFFSTLLWVTHFLTSLYQDFSGLRNEDMAWILKLFITREIMTILAKALHISVFIINVLLKRTLLILLVIFTNLSPTQKQGNK